MIHKEEAYKENTGGSLERRHKKKVWKGVKNVRTLTGRYRKENCMDDRDKTKGRVKTKQKIKVRKSLGNIKKKVRTFPITKVPREPL